MPTLNSISLACGLRNTSITIKRIQEKLSYNAISTHFDLSPSRAVQVYRKTLRIAWAWHLGLYEIGCYENTIKNLPEGWLQQAEDPEVMLPVLFAYRDALESTVASLSEPPEIPTPAYGLGVQIAEMLCNGHTTAEILSLLGISKRSRFTYALQGVQEILHLPRKPSSFPQHSREIKANLAAYKKFLDAVQHYDEVTNSWKKAMKSL